MKSLLFSIFFSFFSACSLTACDSDVSDPSSLLIRSESPSGDLLLLEIADDAEERREGLMFRKNLAENQGMLFVFPEESPRSFWMKNTLIPLDLVYLNAEGKVVDLKSLPPCPAEATNCPSYPSNALAQYVLEINAGSAQSFGFELGSKWSLPQ